MPPTAPNAVPTAPPGAPATNASGFAVQLVGDVLGGQQLLDVVAGERTDPILSDDDLAFGRNAHTKENSRRSAARQHGSAQALRANLTQQAWRSLRAPITAPIHSSSSSSGQSLRTTESCERRAVPEV